MIHNVNMRGFHIRQGMERLECLGAAYEWNDLYAHDNEEYWRPRVATVTALDSNGRLVVVKDLSCHLTFIENEKEN